MLNEGQVIERFTVEARLGEGGMAEVYRVRHNALGSLHALKLLKVQGEAIRRRLVTEGQVQAVVRHPNIVAVTDVVFLGEQPGLVMDLVEGPSLEDWLSGNQPTVDEAEALFRGVLAGVAKAHRAGLVHRDLKPGNVLLDDSDGVVVPKVTDFGLAKVLDNDESMSMTRSGVAMGTPQYMAPEQIRNAKDVDQRADVWALGCILYQLVCGRRPFDSADIIELYAQIGRATYPPPRSITPDLPERFERAIAGCLVADREGRIADCDALRAILAGGDPEEAAAGAARSASLNTRSPIPRITRPIAAETFAASPIPADLPSARGAAPAPSSEPPGAPQAAPAPATRDVAPMAPRTPRRPIPLWLPVVGLLGLLFAVVGVGMLWLAVRSKVEGSSPGGTDGAPTEASGPTSAETPSSEEPSATAEPTATEPTATEPTATEPTAAEPTATEPTATEPAASTEAAPEPTREKPSTPQRGGTRPGRTTESTPSAPATTSTGTVVVTGDAQRVVLRSGSKVFRPGDVPVGTYTPIVTFLGDEPIELKSFNVEENETVTITCNAMFAKCRVR